jgi:flagellar motor switch protein FliG
MSAPEKTITGAQKVAALLLSLDRTAAAAVLQKLDPKIVAEVAAAMTELDASFQDAKAIDALYGELSRTLHAPTRLRTPDDVEMGALLDSALGKERSKSVLHDIHVRRKSERPFARLERLPSHVVAGAMGAESTAVTALVLAHLEPRQSAEILSSFEPERALDVVQRMSKVVPPGLQTLTAVAEALLERVDAVGTRPAPIDPATRLKTIAQMLTLAEKSVEQAVLEGLEQADKAMVGEIREFMFTWNDLAGIDKRGMQKVLSSVETRTLAIALKACPADVEANVMQNLSVRVRVMVAEERDIAGPMPMTEVLAARAEIMRSVRSLMDAGDLATGEKGEQLVT